MTALRAGVFAAVGAVVAWALKAIVIAAAGGLDRSPLEGPLFFLGLLLLATAFVAGGLALAVNRGTGVRIFGAIGGLLLGLLAFVLVEEAVGSMVPESAGWVREEAGLWVASVLTAALMLTWWRRRADREPSPTA